jgi:serine/threonine-protein kinase
MLVIGPATGYVLKVRLAGAPLALPDRLGHYTPLALLGVGGMATVYLARAPNEAEHVALKLMHPHLRLEGSWSRQFVAEAKIAAGLAHPNVVAVTEIGDDETGLYLVMKYIEGDSLSGFMRGATARNERIPMGVALRILVDALAGLHAAHELCDGDGRRLALVHRDFSPQNVLVGTDGIARLTDFGIAKILTGDRTRSGMVKGKLIYMSPEQISGLPLDRRSDVWAGGVVAWELVTGQRMHPPDQDEMVTVVRVASSTPPRVRDIRSDIPQAIDAAIAAALEPSVDRRLASAEALRNRLLESGEVADTAEVAAYVAQAAGERLRTLRAQASRSRGDPILSRLPSVDSAPGEGVMTTGVRAHTSRVESDSGALPSRSKRIAAAAAVLGVCVVVGMGVALTRWPRPAARANLALAPPSTAPLPRLAEPHVSADEPAASAATPPAPAPPLPSTSPTRAAARKAVRPPSPNPIATAIAAPASQPTARKALLRDPLDGP